MRVRSVSVSVGTGTWAMEKGRKDIEDSHRMLFYYKLSHIPYIILEEEERRNIPSSVFDVSLTVLCRFVFTCEPNGNKHQYI